MARRDEKRAEIVETLAGHLLAAGLGETGLRRLAAVAGTSDRMLLYYFENKEEILGEVLTRIASGLTEGLAGIVGDEPLPPARALEGIWPLIHDPGARDQLRLWLDLSSRASRGDAFSQEVVARIREDWVAALSAILDVPTEDERRTLALLMMSAIDGQVVLFPDDPVQGSVAIAALVAALERD